MSGALARPYLSRAADRPRITHGAQSGDVTGDSGVVWARTDRPARMMVEVATTESFADIRSGTYVDALPESDFTAKALLAFQKASNRELGENLPPSYGLQFFGHVAIDAASQAMTVTLKDVGDKALWSIDLAPVLGSS